MERKEENVNEKHGIDKEEEQEEDQLYEEKKDKEEIEKKISKREIK